MKRRFSPLSQFALRSAFTLVELLVSMAVLTLLILLVAQLTNSANMTITGSRKHMDSDNEARVVMDRLASDISSMVLRTDVDVIVKGWYSASGTNSSTTAIMPGNDSIYFFSESPGYNSSSYTPPSGPSNGIDSRQMNTCSIVGYNVMTSGSATLSYELDRYGSKRGWEDMNKGNPPMVYLTYSSVNGKVLGATSLDRGSGPTNFGTVGDNYTAGTSQDFEPIGEQAFRFEYCYLLKDGTFSIKPYLASHTITSALGLKDVSAIVVAIAMLDTTSRKIVNNSQLAKLVTALPDAAPTASGSNLMAEAWKNVIYGSSFASNAGIPQSVAGQVRVYQRFFYLNN